MKRLSMLITLTTPLILTGCYSAGQQRYDGRTTAECEQLVDPAAISECRLDASLEGARRRADQRDPEQND